MLGNWNYLVLCVLLSTSSLSSHRSYAWAISPSPCPRPSIFSPIRCWIGFLKNILDLRSCTFFSTRPRLGKTDLHYTISYFIMSQVCTAVLLVVVIAHWREETVTWNSRMQNELSWVWCVLSRQTLDFASIYFFGHISFFHFYDQLEYSIILRKQRYIESDLLFYSLSQTFHSL